MHPREVSLRIWLYCKNAEHGADIGTTKKYSKKNWLMIGDWRINKSINFESYRKTCMQIDLQRISDPKDGFDFSHISYALILMKHPILIPIPLS